MNIGLLKEIKPDEYRVAIAPFGVRELTALGHSVWVESNAGLAVGFRDSDYQREGAQLLSTAAQVFEQAELIVKVKEPQPQEWPQLTQRHTLLCYLHLAASQALTNALIRSKATCIAYETIQVGQTLPLLAPMSELAGRLAVQMAALHLLKPMGGQGLLLGGITGIEAVKVVVIGIGIAGYKAAEAALGLGARVTILDIEQRRLQRAKESLLASFPQASITAVSASRNSIINELKHCQMLVGAVLVPGGSAPKLLQRADLQYLSKGAIVADIAIDQGGCFTTSKPTTHTSPVYDVDGILHYCVANIPSAAARTATEALANANLPYIKQLANEGTAGAAHTSHSIATGINIVNGLLVNSAVADAFKIPVAVLSDALKLVDFD